MFECIEMPSLIPERYEMERNPMANYNDSSVTVRADLPYERKMELLHEQRIGELRKARNIRIAGIAVLVFITVLAFLRVYSTELAYLAGSAVLAGVTLATQNHSTLIGVINSRMEVLATENASRNSAKSPPIREGREKATWRTRKSE